MNCIFLVHTPYHLILSTGIAATDRILKKNILIVFRDFDIESIRFNTLNNIFDEIIIVNGNLDSKRFCGWNSIIKKTFEYKKTISVIKGRMRKYDIDHLFTYNDNIIVDKKIMQLANEKRRCEIIYVEDGSAAYNDSSIKQNKLLIKFKCAVKSIFFNLKKYGKSVNVIGASSYIDQCMLLYPKYARKELLDKEINEISSNQFREGILKVYHNYIEKVGILNNCLIIFLDISELGYTTKDTYINVIKEVIKTCMSCNKEVYIKYHPRETCHYMEYALREYSNLHYMDKNIPSEAILYNCGDRVVIIASNSTSLFSVNKLSHNVTKISLLNVLNLRDRQVKVIYEKLGVLLPLNIYDLKNLLIAEFND